MDPKESPMRNSLYKARMKEYHELKINRWYPDFLDYLALPTYLIEETRDVARAVLDSEKVEADGVAKRLADLANGNGT